MPNSIAGVLHTALAARQCCVSGQRQVRAMQGDRPSLTLNEVRVARLVAEGRSDEEIAGQLAMAVDEVVSALSAVLRKLALRSRTELALLLPPIGAEVPHSEPSERAARSHPR